MQNAERPAADLANPALYINRETSWLAFNARVLDQALDVALAAARAAEVPGHLLVEPGRVLHDPRLRAARAARGGGAGRGQPRRPLGAASSSTRIGQIIRGQLETAATLLADDLLPALAGRGIRIHDWSALDAETKKQARKYFRRSVFPVVTPLAVDPGHPFPFLSNLSLSLAVEARDPGDEGTEVRAHQGPGDPPALRPLRELRRRPHGRRGRRRRARLPAARAAAGRQPRRSVSRDGDPGDLSVSRHPRHGLRHPRGRGARSAVDRRPRDPAPALRRLRAAGGRAPASPIACAGC